MNKEFVKGVDYIGVSVTFVCHDGKGRILMHKRNSNCRDEHDRWDTGGGGLRFGEKVEDCLQREVKEEYCAEVLDHELIAVTDLHREHNGKPTHWICFTYKVLVDPEKVKIGEPEKFDDLKWFTLDTLPKNLHSQLPKFFEKWRSKLL